MAAYVVSVLAERDIDDLGTHIRTANEQAAARLIDEIYAAFELLVDMPDAGHTRSDLTSQQVRFWTIRKRYLVVYRRQRTTVEIVRVLDGRRDVASILR